MTKLRTAKQHNQQHKRAAEFHQKLERGANTADLHRRKVKHNAEEVAPPPARGSSTKARSHAAQLVPGSPSAQAGKTRPEGGPDTGNDPGALLKR